MPDVPRHKLSPLRRAALALAAAAAPATITACGGARPAMEAEPAYYDGANVRPQDAEREFSIARGTMRGRIAAAPGAYVENADRMREPTLDMKAHPFVSGSCGGDAAGCEEVVELLRQSSTFDDFLRLLGENRFQVTALR